MDGCSIKRPGAQDDGLRMYLDFIVPAMIIVPAIALIYLVPRALARWAAAAHIHHRVELERALTRARSVRAEPTSERGD
jgi:hypothetical protein